MNFKISLEYLEFTPPMVADKEKEVYVTYIYHKDNPNEIYGIIFVAKKEGTFRYYREVTYTPDDREEVLIEHIKKFLGNQLGMIKAQMGLNAEIKYTVTKKDKDGNVIDTHKCKSKTVKKL